MSWVTLLGWMPVKHRGVEFRPHKSVPRRSGMFSSINPGQSSGWNGLNQNGDNLLSDRIATVSLGTHSACFTFQLSWHQKLYGVERLQSKQSLVDHPVSYGQKDREPRRSQAILVVTSRMQRGTPGVYRVLRTQEVWRLNMAAEFQKVLRAPCK